MSHLCGHVRGSRTHHHDGVGLGVWCLGVFCFFLGFLGVFGGDVSYTFFFLKLVVLGVSSFKGLFCWTFAAGASGPSLKLESTSRR